MSPVKPVSPTFLRIAGVLLIVAAAPALVVAIPNASLALAFVESFGLAAFYAALAVARYPRGDTTSVGLAGVQSIGHLLIVVIVLFVTEVGSAFVLVLLVSIALFACGIAYGVVGLRSRDLIDPLRPLPLVLAIGAFVGQQIENLIQMPWAGIFGYLLYVIVGFIFIMNARHPNGRSLAEVKGNGTGRA